MAERRMFTKKVTDDDNFMSLSASAQALYLHLSMSADDDGFCNQVSAAMFKAHASVQDLEALLSKRYIYQFENGVIVIKHWRMANALRKDRYTPTAFQEELKKLKLKDNGSYTFSDDDSQLVAGWLPDGCQVVATDKDSIGKDRLDKDNIYTTAAPEKEIFIKITLNDKSEYEVTYEEVAAYQELYPAVDVKQQFRNMKGWCDANPTNRKTRSGIKRFINGWLSKEQNRGGSYKPEIEKTSGKNFDANKGLIKGHYDFAALEAETKNRHLTTETKPIIEPEKKQLSKLQKHILSLPINKDFHFEHEGKEFWGTRYENSVCVLLKSGDNEQFLIDKLEEHLDELPDYRGRKND